jgi:hypothetical protein
MLWYRLLAHRMHALVLAHCTQRDASTYWHASSAKQTYSFTTRPRVPQLMPADLLHQQEQTETQLRGFRQAARQIGTNAQSSSPKKRVTNHPNNGRKPNNQTRQARSG